MEKKSKKRTKKLKSNNQQWRFIIKVREGESGFADNDEYISKWFISFEKCFVAYIKFNPEKHFKYLRFINQEIIQYKSNNEIYNNEANDGKIYYNKDKIE